MSLDYTTYLNQIANLMATTTTSSDFTVMAPGMIDYAEGRVYRDADLLFTQVTDATAFASSGDRNFTLPITSSNAFSGIFIIVDNINVITPVTTTSSNGTRIPLTPTSRDFLDMLYPSGQTVTGVPSFWAMASNTEVIFGPSPDAAYNVEIIGVQRPNPLSASNSSTFLTQYVPDVFIAASMVFASGFQRDFSAQGDNPAQGNSWEAQYSKLFQSMNLEQIRAKYQSEAWTSESPSPVATPKRV